MKLERRGEGVFAHGADSAAVVTDITLNADPEGGTREWIRKTALGDQVRAGAIASEALSPERKAPGAPVPGQNAGLEARAAKYRDGCDLYVAAVTAPLR